MLHLPPDPPGLAVLNLSGCVSHVQVSLDETNTWTEVNILSIFFLTFSSMVSWMLRGKKDYSELGLGSDSQIYKYT